MTLPKPTRSSDRRGTGHRRSATTATASAIAIWRHSPTTNADVDATHAGGHAKGLSSDPVAEPVEEKPGAAPPKLPTRAGPRARLIAACRDIARATLPLSSAAEISSSASDGEMEWPGDAAEAPASAAKSKSSTSVAVAADSRRRARTGFDSSQPPSTAPPRSPAAAPAAAPPPLPRLSLLPLLAAARHAGRGARVCR
eukprot:257340-Chlamydomonas_euryale.AAC.2